MFVHKIYLHHFAKFKKQLNFFINLKFSLIVDVYFSKTKYFPRYTKYYKNKFLLLYLFIKYLCSKNITPAGKKFFFNQKVKKKMHFYFSPNLALQSRKTWKNASFPRLAFQGQFSLFRHLVPLLDVFKRSVLFAFLKISVTQFDFVADKNKKA